LTVHHGIIYSQFHYFKLDRAFLQRSPYLYIRGKEQPIEFTIIVVANVGDDKPVFVIKEFLVPSQISSVEYDLAR
jgi:hypothetical protein